MKSYLRKLKLEKQQLSYENKLANIQHDDENEYIIVN